MYNWGIIGSDLIAEDFINELVQTNHICKVAQCNQNKIRKRFPNLQYYETVEELYKDKVIQVVYISTYVDQHQDIIMEALHHGLHVVAEKPLFLNAAYANDADNYAKKHGLLLAEANTLFYMPIYKQIEKMLHEGKIGKLKMIRCDFGSLKDEDVHAPIFCECRGGGALYDIGIYALTATMMFLKKPIDMQSCTIRHHYGVDEAWSIMLKNSKQELANISLSIRCKMEKRLIIAGDHGYIEILNYPRADKFTLVGPTMKEEYFTIGSTIHALRYEIEGIEEMITTKHYQNSHLKLTCDIMRMMDKIRKESVVC